MKLSALIFCVTCAVGSLASSSEAEQLKTIIENGEGPFTQLDQTVQGLNNGNIDTFQDQMATVLSTLGNSTTEVQGLQGTVSTFDCLKYLKDPAEDFEKDAANLANTLKSQHTAIQNYKQCSNTYSFITNCISESQALVSAVLPKLDSSARGKFHDGANKFIEAFQQIQPMFGPTSCSDA